LRNLIYSYIPDDYLVLIQPRDSIDSSKSPLKAIEIPYQESTPVVIPEGPTKTALFNFRLVCSQITAETPHIIDSVYTRAVFGFHTVRTLKIFISTSTAKQRASISAIFIPYLLNFDNWVRTERSHDPSFLANMYDEFPNISRVYLKSGDQRSPTERAARWWEVAIAHRLANIGLQHDDLDIRFIDL
jgi:hypothetical protein